MSVTDLSPDVLIRTRTSLHGVAEHVLAAAARAATGSIRLYVRDGALSTPDLDADGSRLELREGRLLRRPTGPEVPLGGTFGDLARGVGAELGLSDPPYHLATHVEAADVVDVDQSATATLLEAWRTGDEALRRLDPASTPVLWPEHFDVGITRDAVNYGVSPGDGYEPWPYAYVGPHDPLAGDFWNAPFGAARRLADLDGPDAVLAFFREGQARASRPADDAARP